MTIKYFIFYELLEELTSIRSGTLVKLPPLLLLTKAPPSILAPEVDPVDDEFPFPVIAPAAAALLLFPVLVSPAAGSVLGLAASLFCDDGDSCLVFGPPPDPPPFLLFFLGEKSINYRLE